MPRLTADFSSAFKRDLKKKARRRGWDLSELERGKPTLEISKVIKVLAMLGMDIHIEDR